MTARTYEGAAIFEDSEEVLISNAVILDTVHDKSAIRSAITHVVKVRINTGNGSIIPDVVHGIFSIAMLLLSGLHLFAHSLHAPAGSIIILVVGHHRDVAPRDVGCCQIIDNLLVVSSHRPLLNLSDAGGQCGGFTREDLVIGGSLLLTISIGAEPVCEGIAAGLADVLIYTIREVGPLQRDDTLIARIALIDVVAYVIFRGSAAKTVVEEIPGTQLIREACCEVVLHDGI